MSIASELDAVFEQRVAKANAQGFMLRQFAQHFVDGFIAYVEAIPNVWNKSDGRAGGARVRLGEGENSEFKPMAWPHLRTSLGAIDFSVSYTLSCRETDSTFSIIFPLNVRVVEDGYRVKFNYQDSEYWVAPSEKTENRFSDVYAAMVDNLKRLANPDTVIIHKAE